MAALQEVTVALVWPPYAGMQSKEATNGARWKYSRVIIRGLRGLSMFDIVALKEEWYLQWIRFLRIEKSAKLSLNWKHR